MIYFIVLFSSSSYVFSLVYFLCTWECLTLLMIFRLLIEKKTVCDVPTGSHFLLSMARLLLLLLLLFNFVKAMMEVHFFVFL
jgi:hypothetical protein